MKPIQYRQVRPIKIRICEHKLNISQNVPNQYGEENGYTNTYRYCSKLKKRLTTRSCIGCVFFKPKQE